MSGDVCHIQWRLLLHRAASIVDGYQHCVRIHHGEIENSFIKIEVEHDGSLTIRQRLFECPFGE